MKDKDYIKAGVELADGFSIAVGGLFQTPRGNAVEYTVFNDALAAQLVRQVDALGHDTKMGVGFCQILNARKSVLMAHVDGSDRTMNAIKVIVDSKVLA